MFRLDGALVSDLVEQFLALIREHYWIAVVLVFFGLIFVTIYIEIVFAGVFKHIQRLQRSMSRWDHAVAIIAGTAALFGASMAVVTFSRQVPVAGLSNLNLRVTDYQILQWDVPKGSERTTIVFEIQQSKDPTFRLQVKTDRVVDHSYPLAMSLNEIYYYRVRAHEFHEQEWQRNRSGHWSNPVRVEQFVNGFEKIRRTRVLAVAVENDFGQTAMRWYENETYRETRELFQAEPDAIKTRYHGMEVELARLIADKACQAIPGCDKVEVRFLDMPWSEVMTSVAAGSADMAISAVTFVPEREAKYRILFGNESYFKTGFALVRRRSGAVEDDKVPLKAANLKGLNIAVQDETTALECLTEANEPKTFTISKLKNSNAALNAMLSSPHVLDAVIEDMPTSEAWTETHPADIAAREVDFKASHTPHCREQEYRIAFRSGDIELRDFADQLLAELKAPGPGSTPSRLESIHSEVKSKFRSFMARAIQAARDKELGPGAATRDPSLEVKPWRPEIRFD